MEFIKSVSNSRLKWVAGLKLSSNRAENNTFIAEGVRVVLDAPQKPVELYVTKEHEDIGREFEKFCPVYSVSQEAFEKMSDTKAPQGVLGVFQKPDTTVNPPKCGNAIVLDGVSDPGNVGTIIRTAGACGFRDVYLVNCADCFAPKVVRSSMGGVFRTNINIGSHQEVFDALRQKNYAIYSLDMGGESVFDKKVGLPCALVVGSEARGVSEFTRKEADGVLCLPMVDDTESLNAAVSACTAMYVINFSK